MNRMLNSGRTVLGLAAQVLALVLLFGWLTPAGFGAITAAKLRCEYLDDPRSIDTHDPRFFWVVASADADKKQSAYRLLVAYTRQLLKEERGDLYDSGKVSSSESTQIVYKGAQLASATDCYWTVKVWDQNDQASAWSESASFSTGLFSKQAWDGAQWIAWRPQQEWASAWKKRKDQEVKVAQFDNPKFVLQPEIASLTKPNGGKYQIHGTGHERYVMLASGRHQRIATLAKIN